MKGQAIQKVRIRLRSPSPTRAGEGGFVIPFRPWDYYFSDPESVFRVLCGDKSNSGSLKYKLLHTNRQTVKEQYLEAAVTYDELFAAARPGTWVRSALLPSQEFQLKPNCTSSQVANIPGG